jgi:hypothetical protein
VTASHDRTAKIWEASSGKCLQTLETNRALYEISFDSNGQVLTEIGPLHFDVLLGPKLPAVTPATEKAYNQILGLSDDGTWITVALEKVVWLPSEYRPSCSAVLGKVMVVGVGNGRVWLCSVNK